jgi:hypothetical protein
MKLPRMTSSKKKKALKQPLQPNSSSVAVSFVFCAGGVFVEVDHVVQVAPALSQAISDL